MRITAQITAIVLLFAAAANAQPTWVQCDPYGYCQPQYCPPQGGGIYIQPPRIDVIPRQQPRQYDPRIRPDGRPAPPAPSTLEPVKPVPDTTPPAVTQPSQPTIDPKALDELRKEIENQRSVIREEISLLSSQITMQPPCNCKPCDLTSVNAKLDQINTTLVNIGGPQSPPSEVVHYVLVADTAASYWRRVGDLYLRAHEKYSQVRTAPPPTFPVGPLPQLVAYSSGKPLGAFRGQHAVENALTLITNGETPTP